MRKNSIKNTRVNGAVQKELSTIIHSEIKDPRIHPMTSVTAVEVAPDLKTCKAYISVLGEQQAKDSTLLSWYLYHNICFYLIQFVDIIEFLKYKTTFVSGSYFFYIIFESFQGCQRSFKDLCSFT